MPIGDPKPESQRAAVLAAWFDRGIRNRARIGRLARAGQLVTADGEPLPAFEIADSTIRGWIKREERARVGLELGPVAEAKPRDAIEILRIRLVSMADHELAKEKRRQDRGKDLDPERMRGITRWVVEAAKIPGPTEPQPSSQSKVDPATGKQAEQRINGGRAGALLRDHRSNGLEAPARRRPHTHGDDGEQPRPEHTTPEQPEAETGDAPGSRPSVRTYTPGLG